MPVNYKSKKVLIVDDFADFRRTVRGITLQLGVPEVDQAATGEDAIKLCRERHYDIILSDYNLGDGKDGQQLLEELKYSNLIRNQDVFLMITAENTAGMVMGALDIMPDGYLTKPFNKAMLQNRLDKIVEKKEALAPIEQAIAKREFEQALNLIRAQLAANTSHALACQRLEAEVLEKLGQVDEAMAAYQRVLTNRALPWAMQGLGKLHFSRGDYEQARALFAEITRVNPMFLSAYDWLARCETALGDNKKAQGILEAAVKIAPKTITRQMQLGELARQNQDIDVMVKAYRSAVRLGKNSCYNNADNYVHFAQGLQQKIVRDGVRNCKGLAEDAARALSEAAEQYKDDKNIRLRIECQRAGLAEVQNRPKDAEAARAKMTRIASELGAAISPEAMLDVARVLKKEGQDSEAEDLLQNLTRKHGDSKTLLSEARGLMNDSRSVEQSEQAHELNLQGVRNFELGQLRKALTAFMRARELAPENISINLNCAQAIVRLSQEGQADGAMLRHGLRCLEQVGTLSEQDERYARHQQLLRLTQELLDEKA